MLRIPFRVMRPDVDEHVLPGEAPDRYVTRLSRAKAEAVLARAPGELILAADTTVVLDGAIFEKPTSPGHAVEMLSRLQGQTHEVMTAVAVARDGDLAQALDVSRVTFRPADRPTLEAYVATGEPLDKFMGDAIMALWGAPIAHADDADRAMTCALEQLGALEKMNAKWKAQGRQPVAIGIGINFGEVFAGNIGSDRRLEYTVIGDAVNTASRLCSSAGLNEILISEPFYKALKKPPKVEALEPVQVKGKAKKIPVYRVKR